MQEGRNRENHEEEEEENENTFNGLLIVGQHISLP